MNKQKFEILAACALDDELLAKYSNRPDISLKTARVESGGELAKAAASSHALLVRSDLKIDEKFFASTPLLKVVGLAGTGTENIDINAATRRGIAVVNAPTGDTVATAEHAISLMMSLARFIPQASASVKAKKQKDKHFIGRELKGKTLGIIGFGNVGSAAAVRALGLQMKVLACDPYAADEKIAKLGVKRADLNSLLQQSDVISVHVPLTKETAKILGEKNLGKIKKGAMIVNCSKEEIIDENALYNAIQAGTVAGAALDLSGTEPPSEHPLYALDQVVLTPNLGASTVEARANAAEEAIENIIQYLTSGSAANILNLPPAPLEKLERLGPFMDLAERLGLLMNQISQEPIHEAAISSQGQTVEEGADLIAASFLKGLLTPVLSTGVNIINAPAIARERGVKTATVKKTDSTDFTDLISIEVKGPWGKSCVEGTIFGKRQQRLVRLDDFRLDALPIGNLVLIYNEDVPGVIGSIGNCFGKNNINISRMYNGRNQAGGKAVNLVNTDQEPTKEVLDQLLSLPNIVSVKAVRLPDC